MDSFDAREVEKDEENKLLPKKVLRTSLMCGPD